MKKIIIYLATMLLAAMTFTGCYDLETYPGDKVNEGTFYKTGDHAHQGLMGIYGMLRLNEAYGYQFCFDHLGDIAYGYNYYMMFLATYTDRDGTIQAHWQTFYDGIHRVNTFIRSVKGMGGIITDEQINEYVAEAKFLRAMFYFSLTDLFGVIFSMAVISASASLLARSAFNLHNSSVSFFRSFALKLSTFNSCSMASMAASVVLRT